MPTLTGTTVVADRHGMPVLLREGDPLPEWAVGKVGAHLLSTDDGPPPKAGAGSSNKAWAAYATDVLNLDVPDGTPREEIIAAVEAALEQPED